MENLIKEKKVALCFPLLPCAAGSVLSVRLGAQQRSSCEEDASCPQDADSQGAACRPFAQAMCVRDKEDVITRDCVSPVFTK